MALGAQGFIDQTSRLIDGRVDSVSAWAELSPGTFTDRNQSGNRTFDTVSKLVDIGHRVIVGGDTEHQIIAVAKHGYARAEVKRDRRDR